MENDEKECSLCNGKINKGESYVSISFDNETDGYEIFQPGFYEKENDKFVLKQSFGDPIEIPKIKSKKETCYHARCYLSYLLSQTISEHECDYKNQYGARYKIIAFSDDMKFFRTFESTSPLNLLYENDLNLQREILRESNVVSNRRYMITQRLVNYSFCDTCLDRILKFGINNYNLDGLSVFHLIISLYDPKNELNDFKFDKCNLNIYDSLQKRRLIIVNGNGKEDFLNYLFKLYSLRNREFKFNVDISTDIYIL